MLSAKQNNSFNLMVECEECKKQFPVSQNQAPNSINHKREYKVNGQSIFLTYYDCPHCGKRHFVQIDDANSLQQLVKTKNMFIKLSIAKKKGKSISKKQSENFNKSRQDLSNYRINLMKEFTGKTIVDSETGEETILKFSVC